MFQPRASALQFRIRFIDRPKEFAEARCLFDRPYPVEGWPQRTQIALGKQADGYDALVHLLTLRNLIYVKERT